jgi:hypothetical protein
VLHCKTVRSVLREGMEERSLDSGTNNELTRIKWWICSRLGQTLRSSSLVHVEPLFRCADATFFQLPMQRRSSYWLPQFMEGMVLDPLFGPIRSLDSLITAERPTHLHNPPLRTQRTPRGRGIKSSRLRRINVPVGCKDPRTSASVSPEK